ncbi:MAG: RNA-binding protein [Desulfurococcales archaeon ex4484_58]|nr:MAG: RNA-binding protein [Desulfurococcales archaeon ex4484_58]
MGRRHVLSKRDKKKILSELNSFYTNLNISRDDVLELFEERNMYRILLINGEPGFFYYNSKWFPHLKLLLKKLDIGAPIVVVDTGAVKPLLRGADLMAPGIREIKGSFKPGDPVIVVEEKMGKPFMVGVALISSMDIVSGRVKRGKVVENIHRIGDKLWNIV